MKKLYTSLVFALTICTLLSFTACNGDDDNNNNGNTGYAEAIAGTYDGYIAAEIMGSTIYYTDRTAKITANTDGTVNFYSSNEDLGTYDLRNVAVTKANDTYSFEGSGKVNLAMTGKEPAEYEYQLKGSVKSATDAEFIISLPIMGGTNFKFITGTAPADKIISGIYKGYLISTFFGTSTYYEDHTLTVTANTDGTVNFSYSAPDPWNNYELNNLTITTTENIYGLTGEGKVSLAMSGGEPKEYDFTMNAAIKSVSDAEFIISLPIMGGTELKFVTGTVPVNKLIAGTYKGYTVATFAYGNQTYPDCQLSLTANEDGTVNFSFTAPDIWGVYEMDNLEITKSDDAYILGGEGKISLAMSGGEPKEYDFTMNATIKSVSDAEFVITLPIMGTTELKFITGDMP